MSSVKAWTCVRVLLASFHGRLKRAGRASEHVDVRCRPRRPRPRRRHRRPPRRLAAQEAAPRPDQFAGNGVGAGRLPAKPLPRPTVPPGAEQERHLDGVGGAEASGRRRDGRPGTDKRRRRRRPPRPEPPPTGPAARRPSRRWRSRPAATVGRPGRRRPPRARGSSRSRARDPRCGTGGRPRPGSARAAETAATARGRRTWPPGRCGRRARRRWGSRPGPRSARRAGCRSRPSGAHRRGCRGTRAARGALRAARRSVGVEVPQAARVERARPAGGGAQRLRPPRRHRGRLGDVAERRRLQDGAPEQPGRRRGDEQVHRAQRAGRLAGERDLSGVAAERRDVVAHPFERGDLVEQAPVRGRSVRAGGQIGVPEPAEAAQPVVDASRPRCRRPPRAARRSTGSRPHARSRSRRRGATRTPAGNRRAAARTR